MIGFSYLQHLKRTQAIAPVAYGGAGVTPFYYQYHRKAEDHRISATADSSIKKTGTGWDLTSRIKDIRSFSDHISLGVSPHVFPMHVDQQASYLR